MVLRLSIVATSNMFDAGHLMKFGATKRSEEDAPKQLYVPSH